MVRNVVTDIWSADNGEPTAGKYRQNKLCNYNIILSRASSATTIAKQVLSLQ
jgi:hypothetical protein